MSGACTTNSGRRVGGISLSTISSALPPDFSQTAVFRAINVSSSYPFLNQTLALLDAALQQQIQNIPGLAQQLDVIVGNELVR